MGSSLLDLSTTIFIYISLIQVFPVITKYYKRSIVPKKVEVFFTKLMQDAIQLRHEEKIKRDDYLSYVLQLQKKKKLQLIDIAAHTLTFFFDGYETSSAVLSIILYYLGKNESIQQKVRDEVRESLTDNGSVTYDSISDMEYLDQVFNGKWNNGKKCNKYYIFYL